VSRATGETETTQENILDWLQLDEGDSGLQFLIEEEISAVIYIFFNSFSSALNILLNYPFFCFLRFLSFRVIFSFINPAYRLIRMTCPLKLIRISEGLLCFV
jgi:hypothetical protein